MEPNEKQLLKETFELAEENNKILKKMQSSIRWGRFFRLLYWVLIIGSAAGAYYILQPFIASFQETLDTLGTGVDNIQNAGKQIPNLDSFLQNLQKGQ